MEEEGRRQEMRSDVVVKEIYTKIKKWNGRGRGRFSEPGPIPARPL